MIEILYKVVLKTINQPKLRKLTDIIVFSPLKTVKFYQNVNIYFTMHCIKSLTKKFDIVSGEFVHIMM
jgi:hypothetical protein